MSAVLDFITNNSIQCRTVLEPINYSNISNINGVLTLKNSLNNTNYDFIQPDSNKHPSLTNDGITFFGEQHLYSRNSLLLDGLNSYTLLYISKVKDSNNTGNLIQFKKNQGNENLLDYSFNTDSIIQNYSNVSLFNNISVLIGDSSLNTNINLDVGIVKHNIKYGTSLFKINKTETHKINLNKGKIGTNNLFDVILGKDNILDTTLLYFVLAEGELDITLVESLIEVMIKDSFIWESIDSDFWDTISDYIWDNIMTRAGTI